ncbi:MAG: PLP-dependent aminotransferase family protein [Anaerolineales bacterium]|nr:PLP-dependent aminotransferase family protein [Anaerolineales bacterium]
MKKMIKRRFNGSTMTNWDQALAKRTERMKSSAIRELLKLTMQPDIISFAGGLPAPEVFPIKEFQEAAQTVLAEVAEQALQYGPTDGYPPLVDYLVKTMAEDDMVAGRNNILITNGSQQALDLLGRIFINEGDKIITGRPTYIGAIQAWNAYAPTYVTVPLDDDGMRVDELEKVLEANPGAKFIYVLPNFQNPAGTTMPFERRYQLVELAAKYGVFVVEDDPYSKLRFEGEKIPSIYSINKDNTIYTSTFSKTLTPGLRLGWIVAPERISTKLIQAKQGTDLHTSSLVQYLAFDICNRDILPEHIEHICKVYRERRDVMLEALAEHFPPEASWTHPKGGMFLWVKLPESLDADALFKKAVENKVAYVPGLPFYPNASEGENTMRLNFSYSNPDLIREGIKRLGIAIKQQLV